MKINKAKLLVGTLAVIATAATVGSISGTVAWFQYSTRSTVSYTGASAHCTENLQIRIRHSTETNYPWKADLTASDIATYLTNATDASVPGIGRATATDLRPVTTGEFDVENDLVPDPETELFRNPIYQYWSTSEWQEAVADDYVVIPLELRVLDVNDTASAATLAKNIYVSDITLAAVSGDNHHDLSSALRVGISAGTDATALTGYGTFCNYKTNTDVQSVDVHGYLDLNNDGALDTTGNYDWDAKVTHEYGESSKTATALSTKAVSSGVGIADDSDPYDIKGAAIGATTSALTLKVDVLLYLEGWQAFDKDIVFTDYSDSSTGYDDGAALAAAVATIKPVVGKYYKAKDNKYYRYDGKISDTETFTVVTVTNGKVKTALWDSTYNTGDIGAKFNFGIRFSAEAHAKNGVAE